jgi:hypothetical protein
MMKIHFFLTKMKNSENYLKHKEWAKSQTFRPYFKQKILFYVKSAKELGDGCLCLKTQEKLSPKLIIPHLIAQVYGGYERGDISLFTYCFRVSEYFERHPDPNDFKFVVYDERHMRLMEKYEIPYEKSESLLDSPWLNEVRLYGSGRSERVSDLLPNQRDKITRLITKNASQDEIIHERNILDKMLREIEEMKKEEK